LPGLPPSPKAKKKKKVRFDPDPGDAPKAKKKKKVKFDPDPDPGDSSPKAEKSPKKKLQRGRGQGAAQTAGPITKVAPTQQVTVSAPSGSRGGAGAGAHVAALTAKIDKLLKEQAEQKQKKTKNKTFTLAKREYRNYRKRVSANTKAENKAIKKRELAKIRRMPQKDRAAARARLKQLLKERLDAVMKKLPAKIQTPGQLRELMRR